MVLIITKQLELQEIYSSRLIANVTDEIHPVITFTLMTCIFLYLY